MERPYYSVNSIEAPYYSAHPIETPYYAYPMETNDSRCNVKIFTPLMNLVFVGFLLYAVIQSNTDDVKTQCGSLWNWMLARLIIGFSESLIIAGLATAAVTLESPGIGICMGIYIMIGRIIYITCGAVFVSEAMIGNAACYEALTLPSLGPLLGILGWVYMGLDSFVLLIVALFAGCSSRLLCFQSD